MQGRIPEPKTVQRPGSVGAVAFSPDGKLLAIGGAVPAKNGYARGEILVWDVASSQQRHVLAGHPGAVGSPGLHARREDLGKRRTTPVRTALR